MKYAFGVGPDNKAPRPIDNVGLQYGLANLLNGTLDKERFVDVNWRIGGMDIDGVWQPQRTEADLGALATLYRTGRISDGSGSANVAEIDLRNNPTDVGFHPPFHSWTWRARIDRTLGNHDNNVIWVQRTGGTPPSQFEEMRKWLDAVYSDPSADPLPIKIKNNKPATVQDTCYANDANGGNQSDLFCTGTPAQWQYYGHMRMVAGMPFTLDAFKCQLKPLEPADYPGINFTGEEWAKLQQAFPTGVCDFSKPADRPAALAAVGFVCGRAGRGAAGRYAAIGAHPGEHAPHGAGRAGGRRGRRQLRRSARRGAGLPRAGDVRAPAARCAAIGNHVRAQSGKKLSAALASELRRNATSIGQQIGCTA